MSEVPLHGRYLTQHSHPHTMPPAPAGCADLRPGMAVSATVNRVEEYGLLVSVTSSIRCVQLPGGGQAGGCQAGANMPQADLLQLLLCVHMGQNC